MAYIGRPASALTSALAFTQTFTGNGATQFVLTRAVQDSNASLVEVLVSNVQQQPTISYTVTGNVLTFTEAPGSGEPIYVIFRDSVTAPTFTVPPNSVTSAMIQDGSITAAKIADGTVVAAEIADANVTTAKLADGAVTEAKLADANVTTSKIADSAVTVAKISVNDDLSFGGSNLDYAGLGGVTIASSSNVVTLNFQTAAVFSCNLTEESALTPNNVPAGGCVMILKLENGGDHTVTYAGNAKFASGSSPSLTSGGNVDYLFFVCDTDDSYLVIPQLNTFVP